MADDLELIAARSKALEMTGTTSSLIEAFEQWERERQALSDFFDTCQKQETTLAQIKRMWAIISLILWDSKEPNHTRAIMALKVDAKSLQLIIDASDELNKLNQIESGIKVEGLEDLPLFKSQNSYKENMENGQDESKDS